MISLLSTVMQTICGNQMNMMPIYLQFVNGNGFDLCSIPVRINCNRIVIVDFDFVRVDDIFRTCLVMMIKFAADNRKEYISSKVILKSLVS